MSFVKAQQELRANLTSQIREVIDLAEGEKRGLRADEVEKIQRIEADITAADEAIAVAQRNEERSRALAEASATATPAPLIVAVEYAVKVGIVRDSPEVVLMISEVSSIGPTRRATANTWS